MKVVGRVMLFLNCASCSVLKESNTFSWPAKSTNKKRLVLAKLYASVLRVVGADGWVKDERNSVEKTLKIYRHLKLFGLSYKAAGVLLHFD